MKFPTKGEVFFFPYVRNALTRCLRGNTQSARIFQQNEHSTEAREEMEIMYYSKAEINTMAQLYTNALLRGTSIAVKTT